MELSNTVQLERPSVRRNRKRPSFGSYAEQLRLSNERFANMRMGSVQSWLLLKELCGMSPRRGEYGHKSLGMFGVSVEEEGLRRAIGLLMTVESDTPGGLEIDQIFIEGTYRNRGCGRAALRLLEINAQNDSIDSITACSIPDAVEFYERQGYTAESRRGSLTVMRKKLSDTH